MSLTTVSLIISIIGLCSSFVLVGFLPSLVSLIIGSILFSRYRTIENVRVIAISVVGILLPMIMYCNTYGMSLPGTGDSSTGIIRHILATNYANLGIDIGKVGIWGGESAITGSGIEMEYTAENMISGIDAEMENSGVAGDKGDKSRNEKKRQGIAAGDESSDSGGEDEIIYVDNMPGSADDLNARLAAMKEEKSDSDKSDSIFESLDSIRESDKNKGGIVSIAPSDDDMPSYGGIPVGTLLIAQYFREDDHNCNPVLVLQNKTGTTVRYECTFIARDEEGNEMATFDKTVEAVRENALFVFEGRFDKRELSGGLPASYEFSITKRLPYEKEMADKVSVYTSVKDTSAILTAENKSDARVKVDAYVLFFDRNELVDCMWMIPQNTGEVCIDPGSRAVVEGDAYYRFDRVETFYTAYEAVGE